MDDHPTTTADQLAALYERCEHARELSVELHARAAELRHSYNRRRAQLGAVADEIFAHLSASDAGG